ncbi:hypothetical protein Golax_024618 [Gossypium laxum]|uniref:Uncharacterized protein n=1 Tax=Gossypium laxum TaxID=34288 RepID=A0A7J8ZCV4_9ROSI|nr:hypothetical protein [Gossypium laxum]
MLKKARPQPNPPSPPKYVVGKFISKEKVDISLRAISDYSGVPYYERDELFDMELEKFNYLCMDAILAYLTNDCGECKWINKEIRKCIVSAKVGVYFPHLITDLYRQAGVAMDPTEKFHRPTCSVIGYTMIHQFPKLQREQIYEWNLRRTNKMKMATALWKKPMRKRVEQGMDWQ